MSSLCAMPSATHHNPGGRLTGCWGALLLSPYDSCQRWQTGKQRPRWATVGKQQVSGYLMLMTLWKQTKLAKRCSGPLISQLERISGEREERFCSSHRVPRATSRRLHPRQPPGPEWHGWHGWKVCALAKRRADERGRRVGSSAKTFSPCQYLFRLLWTHC